jgi:hypothetical protein
MSLIKEILTKKKRDREERMEDKKFRCRLNVDMRMCMLLKDRTTQNRGVCVCA